MWLLWFFYSFLFVLIPTFLQNPARRGVPLTTRRDSPTVQQQLGVVLPGDHSKSGGQGVCTPTSSHWLAAAPTPWFSPSSLSPLGLACCTALREEIFPPAESALEAPPWAHSRRLVGLRSAQQLIPGGRQSTTATNLRICLHLYLLALLLLPGYLPILSCPAFGSPSKRIFDGRHGWLEVWVAYA